jgi:glutaredoxin 3
MVDVLMYSTPWCPFCVRAKRLLTEKGVVFTDIDISGSGELRQEMIQRSGQRTVPQIWIGEQHIGGCDDLYALERKGQLDSLLAQ